MQNPFGRNLAIDIGTANTVIYQSNNGIVLNEPSIVCINTDTGEILSVGHEARKMVGRTPSHIVSIKPLKDGVVADFETAQKMLRMFMSKVGVKKLFTKPIIGNETFFLISEILVSPSALIPPAPPNSAEIANKDKYFGLLKGESPSA